MANSRISRRHALFGLIALGAMPGSAVADQVFALDWGDLLPESGNSSRQPLRGVVQHGEASLASQQPASNGMRTDWDGKTVRLPGFIVPIDYEGSSVTSFILVPYVGACIHVPPPPPKSAGVCDNQNSLRIRRAVRGRECHRRVPHKPNLDSTRGDRLCPLGKPDRILRLVT